MFWIRLGDDKDTVINLDKFVSFSREEIYTASKQKLYSVRFYEPQATGYSYEKIFSTQEACNKFYAAIINGSFYSLYAK